MRYIAVDYGTKRIGLSVCDELEFGAYPLRTLIRSRSLNHDLGEIARLAEKEEAEGIVVGLPVNADGTHGTSAEAAKAFARSLGKHTPLPIYLHDEFLTTADAEAELIAADVSRKRRREVIDQMAAVHLLESFLRAKQEGKLQEVNLSETPLTTTQPESDRS
jgi:putative Holliday junction resolvase